MITDKQTGITFLPISELPKNEKCIFLIILSICEREKDVSKCEV